VERLADRTGLNRWFLRRRPLEIDSPPDIIISPSDSIVQRVSQIGPDGLVEEKTLFGRQHHLELGDLFPDPKEAEAFRGGWYIKQYLSVLCLHYVIFPCAGIPEPPRRRPGLAWPIVLFRTADVRNERTVFPLETVFGFPAAVIMIASWNVAGIRPAVEPGKRAERGDLLGEFRIGSSVVTLFPPESVEILVGEGEKTSLGHPIARALPAGPVAPGSA